MKLIVLRSPRYPSRPPVSRLLLLFGLFYVFHLELSEIERDVLGQAIFATGTAGGNRADQDLLHGNGQVFQGVSPALRTTRTAWSKCLPLQQL